MDGQLAVGSGSADQASRVPALEPGLHLRHFSGGARPVQVPLQCAEEHLHMADLGLAGGSPHQDPHVGPVAQDPWSRYQQILDGAGKAGEQAHAPVIRSLNVQPADGGDAAGAGFAGADLLARVAVNAAVVDRLKKPVPVYGVEAFRVGIVFQEGDVVHLNGGADHIGGRLVRLHLRGIVVQVLQVTAIGDIGHGVVIAAVVKQAVGRLDVLVRQPLAAYPLQAGVQADIDLGAAQELALGLGVEAASRIQTVQHPAGAELGAGVLGDLTGRKLFCEFVSGRVRNGDGEAGLLRGQGMAVEIGRQLFLVDDDHLRPHGIRVHHIHVGQVAAVVADPGPVLQPLALDPQSIQPGHGILPGSIGNGLLAVKHGVDAARIGVELNEPVVQPQILLHAAFRQEHIGGIRIFLREDIVQVRRILGILLGIQGIDILVDPIPVLAVEVPEAAGTQLGDPGLGGHIDDLRLAVQLPLPQVPPQPSYPHKGGGHQDRHQGHYRQHLRQGKAGVFLM